MIWKDEYASGIEEIDNQHKTLLEFVTEFEKVVEGRAHWNSVPPLITRAREFAKFHFAVEESLMQILDYPQFVAHRAEHQYVLEQFAILEQRVLQQEMKDELLPLVHAWLVRHSIDSDTPFAGHAFGKRGVLGRMGTD
jgi:hemerythrin